MRNFAIAKLRLLRTTNHVHLFHVAARCSLLAARCSLLAARCSLLAARCSLLAPLALQHVGCYTLSPLRQIMQRDEMDNITKG